jgi:hypothetical protein
MWIAENGVGFMAVCVAIVVFSAMISYMGDLFNRVAVNASLPIFLLQGLAASIASLLLMGFIVMPLECDYPHCTVVFYYLLILKAVVLPPLVVGGAIDCFRYCRRSDRLPPAAAAPPCQPIAAPDDVAWSAERSIVAACIVCQKNERCTVAHPCCHLCLCFGCARTLATAAGTARCNCPLCSKPVDCMVRVYIS